jgi:hypothetical protein
MIVALSGRKQSGKSLVSNVLIERGYVRHSFATFLKTTLVEILCLPNASFYDEKQKEAAFKDEILWDSKKTAMLSVLSEESIPHYGDKVLHSIREVMEYVGTDILRRFDRDFHVKKTAKALATYDGDVVIDDMRFPNEVSALKAVGALEFFVMRPFHTEYSNNHVESSVNWTMPEFDSVLVNMGTKEEFYTNLSMAMSGRRGIFGAEATTTDYLFTDKGKRTAEEAGYLSEIGVTQDGILSDPLVSTYSAIYDVPEGWIRRNPFIIENLKMWNAVGDTSNRGLPYQIADDELLSTAYRLGVLTGKYNKLKSQKVLDNSSKVL